MNTAGVAPQTGVHSRWPGLIAAYRDRLAGAADWEPVTLFEGERQVYGPMRLDTK